MKKIFKSLAVCAMLFAMASCSSNPADQVVKVAEKATKEIKAAKSEEAAEKIYEAAMAEIEQIAKNNPDFEPTEAQEEKMDKAYEAMSDAMYDK